MIADYRIIRKTCELIASQPLKNGFIAHKAAELVMYQLGCLIKQ